MYLVLVAGDHRDGPGVDRLSLGSEFEDRVLLQIQEVVSIGDIVHLSNDSVIDADHLHLHGLEDVLRDLVLVDNSADLHGRVANQSIIHGHVNFAFGYLIVLPVGGGPASSSQAGQGAVQVENNLAEGLLIADFHGCRSIELQVLDCQGAGTGVG